MKNVTHEIREKNCAFIQEDSRPFFLLLFRFCVSFSQRLARTISEGTQDIEQIMNRRMIVPPDQMDQHHYAGVTPIIPFSYARQQPTTPKKQAQHDTDV